MINRGRIFKTEIIEIIQSEINDKVSEIIKVPRRKIYKVILASGKLLRFNLYGPKTEEIRLQRIAYNNGVRVPRILSYDQNMKISEWIDGVEMSFVRGNPKVTKQLGRLIGKLNITQDNDKYLAYGDITKRNFIWTEAEKLYVIDFDDVLSADYDEAVRHTINAIARRMSPGRWQWFLEGYTKYHPDLDIDKFIEQANEERECWYKKRAERKRGRR